MRRVFLLLANYVRSDGFIACRTVWLLRPTVHRRSLPSQGQKGATLRRVIMEMRIFPVDWAVDGAKESQVRETSYLKVFTLEKAVGLAEEAQRRRGEPLGRFLSFTSGVNKKMEWEFTQVLTSSASAARSIAVFRSKWFGDIDRLEHISMAKVFIDDVRVVPTRTGQQKECPHHHSPMPCLA